MLYRSMLPSTCDAFARTIRLGFALLLGAALGAAAAPSGTRDAAMALRTSSLRPLVAFEPNLGQAGPSVQFFSRTLRSSLFLMAGGEALLCNQNGSLRMSLGGSAERPAGVGIKPVPGSIHYLIGSDPKEWRTNQSAYSSVKFERVYPGIDLVYGGSEQLEYDFLVFPGADPDVISLEFSGAHRMQLDDAGNLVFSLGSQTLQHRKPRVYQLSGQVRHEVSGRYRRRGAQRVGFEIGAYDHTLPLVIDPVVSYGTFLGGAGNDGAFSVARDFAGNLYVAGITASAAFPLTTGFAPGRTFSGATDAFVAKLNPQGTALVYATYLGGSDQDAAMAIAVDAQGNAYLTGGTNSKDFPVTSGAAQPRFGGTGGSSLPPFTSPAGDGFVAKLGPSGTLVYSSYLGGTGIDQGYGIAVDASGAAFVAGATSSPNFPVTPGVLQPALHGYSDVFVARINPAGTSLLYSTYLGGSLENYAFALGLDSSGNAYVTGITSSGDFPVTSGAFQSRHAGDATGFVAKLNSTGTALAYSTYLGGNNVTYAYGLAVDGSGSAYVTGATTSTDFPTTAGTYQRRAKPGGQGGDVFVTRFAPSGNALMFSSVFGGNGPDFGRAIALDPSGDVYVTGSTGPYGNGRILDFPTTVDAAQRCGIANPTAFLVRLSAGGAALKYSSYLGGSGGASSGAAIALGPEGKVYLAGSTGAADFPTAGSPLQAAFGGGSRSFDSTNLYAFAGDAFLAQMDLTIQSPFTLMCEANAASLAPNLVSPGEIVSFFGSGIGPQTGVAAGFDSAGRLPTILANTRVLFDGAPAPLLFVRSDQVNAITPFALAGKSTTQVQIEYAGARSQVLTIPVTGATPGLFTVDSSGSGQAAALNEDGSYNTPSNPARPGSIVVLFGTGAGILDPIPPDGTVVQETLPRTVPASAYVGSCPAEVLYSGSAPGLIAGAIQVNLRIPEQPPPPAPAGATCGRGDVPVVLLFGSTLSQTTATISLR